MRIGHGEYTTGKFKTGDARALFLTAVQMETPEVLLTLRDQVLPVFCASGWGAMGRNDWENISGGLPPALYSALWTWARQFNLDMGWMLEQALYTLSIWQSCGETAPALLEEPLDWGMYAVSGGGYMLPDSPEDRRLMFVCAGWSPTLEHKDHARARLRAEFDEYLETYFAHMESLVADRGFERTPEKRRRTAKNDPLLHFKWLARCLVQKKSYREIGDTYSVYEILTEDTFYKAIHETAKLVGIALKKAR